MFDLPELFSEFNLIASLEKIEYEQLLIIPAALEDLAV